DGIRDLIVTGVQTCALPILTIFLGSAGILPALPKRNFWKSAFHLCKSVADSSPMKPPEPDAAFEISLRPPAFSEFTGQVKVRERSEERRVGKGCRGRSGWAQ